MESDEFERMFGGMDEELEEKLFQQAIQAMVRLFKTFKANGLTTWETACIIAAWMRNIEPQQPEGKGSDGQN